MGMVRATLLATAIATLVLLALIATSALLITTSELFLHWYLALFLKAYLCFPPVTLNASSVMSTLLALDMAHAHLWVPAPVKLNSVELIVTSVLPITTRGSGLTSSTV